MDISSISCVFFVTLVSHQVLMLHNYSVSAAESEPWLKHGCQRRKFDCGEFKQLGFPFTNETNRPCAPATVDCRGPTPKLTLGTGVYGIKHFTSESIDVSWPTLESTCDIFKYTIRFPNSGAVAFTVSPNITLLKCYKSQQGPEEYQLHTAQDCKAFTVHYIDPRNKLPPPDCKIITLPATEDAASFHRADINSTGGDLFSLLATNFTIRFNVSTQCQECIRKGHRCSLLSSDFQCRGIIAGKKTEVSTATIAAGVLAVGIVTSVVLFYCFRRYKQNKIHQNVEAILKTYMPLITLSRYSYTDVRRMTNSFSEKLGQGGFGEVYKGELRNGTAVAVKVLKETKGDGAEFMNEVTSISRTSHVNIVPLLGYCFEGHRKALICEFMPNGSLDKFLHNENSIGEHHLGLEKLHQISVGIAQGLEYLHRGCNTRILHLDIKPQNILLDEDFCPKISDFGLAKLCHKKESIVSMLDVRGTIGYIAPEVFCRSYGGASHKSDVYSFGMMILDMVGANKNNAVKIDETSELYFPDMIYKRLELVDHEVGGHGNTNAMENERARMMMIVGLWCIQMEPSSRPAMSRVVEMFKGTVESLPIPPRPLLSSPPRELANSSQIDNMPPTVYA